MNYDREIRVQIPDDTIPTNVVFELPDGEQWGVGSGSFDSHDGRGRYQLVQLPNRRHELKNDLARAQDDYETAQGNLDDALDLLERATLRLVSTVRALRDYAPEERAE